MSALATDAVLLYGLPVDTSPYISDGKVIVEFHEGSTSPKRVHIGTAPLTDLEMAGAEGRYIVRSGMADVLAWLGQEVGPPPSRTGRGEALLEQLRHTTENAS